MQITTLWSMAIKSSKQLSRHSEQCIFCSIMLVFVLAGDSDRRHPARCVLQEYEGPGLGSYLGCPCQGIVQGIMTLCILANGLDYQSLLANLSKTEVWEDHQHCLCRGSLRIFRTDKLLGSKTGNGGFHGNTSQRRRQIQHCRQRHRANCC